MRSAAPSSALRRALPVVLLAVLAMILGGLAPAQARAAAVISGSVTGANGFAVSGATVQLGTLAGSTFTTTSTATTGTDGGYTFPSVAAGTYKLRISPPASANYRVAFHDTGSATTVAPADADDVVVVDNADQDIDAILTARPTMAGLVIGADDQPVPGATVRVGTVSGGTFTPVSGVSDVTALDGTFELTSVPNGALKVRISSAAYRASFVVLNADAVTAAASGSDVVVASNAVTGVNTRLVSRKSGDVLAPNGSGISGATVELGTVSAGVFTRSAAVPSQTSAADGSFLFSSVPAGSYRMRITAAGYPASYFDQSGTAATDPADGDNVTITDGRVVGATTTLAGTDTPTVTGTVTALSGGPLEGAAVTLYRFVDGGFVPVTPGATTLADGTYSVAAPTAGTYRLGFTRAGYSAAFFRSPTSTVDSLEQAANIALVGSGIVTGYDAVLAKPGRVNGRLVLGDGSPYAGEGSVQFFRQVVDRDPVTNTTSTSWDALGAPANLTGGTFTAAVPAGSYRVKATLTNDGVGFMPGLVGLDQAATVVVGAEQVTTIPAYSITSSRLSGTVKDRLGRGVAAASLTTEYRLVTDIVDGATVVTTLASPAGASAATTDSAGSFTLRRVSRPGYLVKANGSIDGRAVNGYFPRTRSQASATSVPAAVDRVGVDIVIGDALVLNGSVPWVGGGARTGATLTCNRGTFDPADAALTVQWLSNGNPIANATGTTYAIPSTGAGARFACRVTASRADFVAASVTSLPTGAAAGTFGTAAFENRALPVISGLAETGQTLRVSNGQWSVPPSSFAYAWFADGTAIAGATSSSLVLVPAQLGSVITARVTASNGGSNAAATSAPTPSVVTGAVANTVPPSISGTMKQGEVVTADPGTWAPGPATFGYQWLADGVAVPGATSRTFTPAASEVGKRLSVVVTASTAGYRPGVLESSRGALVAAPDAIASNTLPVVSGSPVVGGTLTTTTGTWTPVPTSFAYQWLADGTAISGATAASYVPVAGDVGKRLSVRVTARRAGSSDGVASSTQTVAVKQSDFVNNTAPIVSGTAEVGSPLTASTGTWTPTPTSFGYQWLADGTPIAGATGTSYTPVAGDVGRRISVTVTARKDGLVDGTATSLQTAAVTDEPAAEPVEVTSGPRIAGTPRPGEILVANSGSFTPSTARATFQWLRSGVPVPGETDGTYAVGGSDLGKRLSVRVTYTPTSGDPVVRTSSATALVKTTAVLTTRVVDERRPLTLNVRVRADNANPVQGTVRVLSDGVQVASGTLSNGQVVLRLRGLKPGRQVVKVVYGGEARVLGQSVVRKVTVRR